MKSFILAAMLLQYGAADEFDDVLSDQMHKIQKNQAYYLQLDTWTHEPFNLETLSFDPYPLQSGKATNLHIEGNWEFLGTYLEFIRIDIHTADGFVYLTFPCSEDAQC